MKKVIVTTTIHSPTRALQAFENKTDWELIVVGDKKTPSDFKLTRGIYLSPEDQHEMNANLSEAIGWNCIQRRNFGFLMAKKIGAKIVATVDDDNIPLENWGENLLLGQEAQVNFYTTQLPVFDPIGATNEKRLWHRGYPLSLVSKRKYDQVEIRTLNAQIQADFWNGDPDVDAIGRLTMAPECTFNPQGFPIASNQLSPFNSQNTFLLIEVLKDYFMFPHVGRMDDIWASYYVQLRGHKVVYGKPSVYQDRNPHDLIEDLRNEYLGYEKNETLVTESNISADTIFRFLPRRAQDAFRIYQDHFKSI